MNYTELTVFTTDGGTELVTALLARFGVEQTWIEQSAEFVRAENAANDKYWDSRDVEVGTDVPCVKAYLPENADALIRDIEAALAPLREECPEAGSLELSSKTVCDESWKDNWKQYYAPAEIGRSLIVCPMWQPVYKEGRTTLLLDPGAAFGSGEHVTTQLCLTLMQSRVQKGGAMLDAGCGSGILAIAGLLLGEGSAVAVDIDPIVENVVRENASLNGIDPERLSVKVGDLIEDQVLISELGRDSYGLITANIVAAVLTAIAPSLFALAKSGGCVIASGIIDERRDEVVASFEKAGFYTEEQLTRDGWVAAVFIKP